MAMVFTDDNFEEEVLKSEIPVMVDLYTDWCGPCQVMGPIIDELADEYEGRIKIGKLNAEENMDTSAEYDVMSVPTYLFFKDGEAFTRFSGGTTKGALKDILERML